jgi:hypothetical protein
MTQDDESAKRFIQTLPYFVWFCLSMGYMFLFVMGAIWIANNVEGVGGVVLGFVLFYPYAWMMWVRFTK